jgi:hypothetical protein
MEPHDPQICAYYGEVQKLEERFKGFKLHHSYRHFNAETDKLSTITSRRKPIPDRVFASDIYEPSMKIKWSKEEPNKLTRPRGRSSRAGHNDQSARLATTLHRPDHTRGHNRGKATLS